MNLKMKVVRIHERTSRMVAPMLIFPDWYCDIFVCGTFGSCSVFGCRIFEEFKD